METAISTAGHLLREIDNEERGLQSQPSLIPPRRGGDGSRTSHFTDCSLRGYRQPVYRHLFHV